MDRPDRIKILTHLATIQNTWIWIPPVNFEARIVIKENIIKACIINIKPSMSICTGTDNPSVEMNWGKKAIKKNVTLGFIKLKLFNNWKDCAFLNKVSIPYLNGSNCIICIYKSKFWKYPIYYCASVGFITSSICILIFYLWKQSQSINYFNLEWTN